MFDIFLYNKNYINTSIKIAIKIKYVPCDVMR